MTKAESNGVYTLGEGRFTVRKGDTMPDGAKFEAISDPEEDVEERAQPAAPENKAKQTVPENRAMKQGA